MEPHTTRQGTAVQKTYPGTADDGGRFGRRGTDFGWIAITDESADKATNSKHTVFSFVVRHIAVDLIECRRNTHLNDCHIVDGGMLGLDSLVDDACVDQGNGLVVDCSTGSAEVRLRGGKAEDTKEAKRREFHVGGDCCS